uniref:Dicistrovirus capsid-polyprotein C-terminal domain-containing protein n=1 Tax=Crocidura shantungensis ribovirus 14 TaxID=3139534 RepID=A0AB38ZK76_9VIRU
MDATRATLDAPYASPFVYYNLLTNEGTIGDFTISVYSPLADVSGSARVGVKVFARFIDIDLQFPTGQTTSVAQSTFSNLTSKVRRLGEGVPSSKLAELKALKKEVTDMIRDFSTLTNHSNDVSVTAFKQKALPNMASSNGSNETHMLSLSSSNALTPMNMGETSTAEMNFQKILNIENYHTNFPVTTSQIAGTEIWREVVNPMVLPNVTGLSVPPNVEVHEYLSFISQPFALWRGPIKYNFRVVKTTFHSVRLRVGWSPVTAANSVIDRDACYTEIIDLKDRNQFTFEVPYVYPISWLSTKTTGSLPLFAGVIFVDIEVQMVAPETVSPSIDVIVERAAGEGFELNMPTTLGKFPIDTRMTETTTRRQPVEAAVVRPSISQPVAHPNPYNVPVSEEEERFDVPAYNVNISDLSYFKDLSSDIIEKAKEIIQSGRSISSQVMTVINDLAYYKYKISPSYLTMSLDQLISIFRSSSGVTDMYAQLPQGILMRKRDTRIQNICVPMEGGDCVPIRDTSTLNNHSNGVGCEKFDQDVMRNLSRDVTFTRPPPALQADNYTLGSSINSVKQMIMRSSNFVVNGLPTPTNPLHIQPHAFAPMGFINGAPGAYVRPAMDNLSYFASIYTFARGGVGLRMITGDENYKFIVDPNLRINLNGAEKLTPAQISTIPWTSQDTTWVSNDITHAINPSVEGFGEVTIPFYSQTYCQAYDMQIATNPYDDNVNLRQPKTHLIVYPYTTPTHPWSAFRHACADFEFSMLSGAPAMVDTAVTDPTA